MDIQIICVYTNTNLVICAHVYNSSVHVYKNFLWSGVHTRFSVHLHQYNLYPRLMTTKLLSFFLVITPIDPRKPNFLLKNVVTCFLYFDSVVHVCTEKSVLSTLLNAVPHRTDSSPH